MIKDKLDNLIQDVEDGKESALKAYCILKDLESFVKECYNKIDSLAMDEASNYNEKTFSEFGYQITKRNGSVTYDYSKDQHYNELNSQLLEYRKLLSNASKIGKAIVDEDTGEIYNPCPIKSGSGDSLAIKKI